MKDFMHYKGYYGSVHFDEDDLVFYGKVCFIKALVSYEATDAQGLKNAFIEAVEDYLAMCLAENIEPETPFKGSLNVRLGNELHRDVAIEAKKRSMTINKFITSTLEQELSRRVD